MVEEIYNSTRSIYKSISWLKGIQSSSWSGKSFQSIDHRSASATIVMIITSQCLALSEMISPTILRIQWIRCPLIFFLPTIYWIRGRKKEYPIRKVILILSCIACRGSVLGSAVALNLDIKLNNSNDENILFKIYSSLKVCKESILSRDKFYFSIRIC